MPSPKSESKTEKENTPLPLPKSVPQCRHIKMDGLRCASPAMRGKRHCYYHHQLHLLQPRRRASAARPQFTLPPLDDPHAIQFAIAQIMQGILNETISDKKAGLLLYALQTASANLPRMQAPQPEQIIRQDYPQAVPELEQVKRRKAVTTDDSLAACLLRSLGLADEAVKFDPTVAQATSAVPTEANGNHLSNASRE